MTRRNTKASQRQQPDPSSKGGSQSSRTVVQKNAPESIEHQQRLLNVFSRAFSLGAVDEVNDKGEGLTARLQKVKDALFRRDFASAFGDQENLRTYAARWSPSRALCYAAVLDELLIPLGVLGREELAPQADGTQKAQDPLERLQLKPSDAGYELISENSDVKTPEKEAPAITLRRQLGQQIIRVIALGGAAAELVAICSLLTVKAQLICNLTLLDSAPWGEVTTALQEALVVAPLLSQYASASARAANRPLVEPKERLRTEFLQRDVLELSNADLAAILDRDDSPTLVTLLFTLNELFTASGIGKTTSFLLRLSSALPIESLLLVIDSPGSYSETKVGKGSKKYPMHWLLDKILLETAPEAMDGAVPESNAVGRGSGSLENGKEPLAEETVRRKWTKLEAHDSRWFRLDKRLQYPIALEDMRYQMHLYHLIEVAETDD